ncbi:MAG: hypothetical protein JWQ08_473 [Deinococcus sp.]|nr:hypothetical protein [Deinococcus sp.]
MGSANRAGRGDVLKSPLLIFLAALCLVGCKHQPDPQAESGLESGPESVVVPAPRSSSEVFRESTRRYLVVTRGTEAPCDALLGEELASVFTRQGQQVLCGKLPTDASTTRRLLDRIYGGNITIPWEVSGDLLTAVFLISDGVEMPVFLFREKLVVLFQLPG